jgi:hypothetical protein
MSVGLTSSRMSSSFGVAQLVSYRNPSSGPDLMWITTILHGGQAGLSTQTRGSVIRVKSSGARERLEDKP